MTIDPITTEVVGSRLREIASSMQYALYHSGYSPILRESKDGTAGLTDRDGRVVIIGGGLQYHLLAYEQAVRKVKERYAERLRPGDSFVVNDPYQAGNAHAPDMVAVTPAFHDGALVGFGVSIAHKADIGGIVPGSSGAAAREIFHDGLLLAAGALPDQRRHRRRDRSHHPQQQPRSRHGARRFARASRLHADGRGAAGAALRASTAPTSSRARSNIYWSRPNGGCAARSHSGRTRRRPRGLSRL